MLFDFTVCQKKRYYSLYTLKDKNFVALTYCLETTVLLPVYFGKKEKLFCCFFCLSTNNGTTPLYTFFKKEKVLLLLLLFVWKQRYITHCILFQERKQHFLVEITICSLAFTICQNTRPKMCTKHGTRTVAV